MNTVTASMLLFFALFCTFLSLVVAKWPPPGQACPCKCSLSKDPQLVYVLGPGKYKQVDCSNMGLREIPSDFPLDTDVVLLNNNNIASLIQDNLDDIRSLKYLDISHNFVTTVPLDTFTYNTQLKLLNIGWNRIRTIDPRAFAPLKQLNRLLIPSNLITSIPSAIANLPALHLLDLSNNQITTVPRTSLTNLPLLQFLNLESNSIHTIDANALRQLPQLINLLLTENQITYLPTYLFRGLQHLDHVALGKNLLVNLPGTIFRGAPRLRNIDLHQNALTYLNPQLFRGMQSLEVINLNGNKLQNIPPGIFQGLRNLQVLDIAGNPHIGTLSVGFFRGLNSLEEISVSHLYNIPEGLFWGLYILETLSITDSTVEPVLGSIFRDLTILQELNLSSNEISVIPDNLFQQLTQLEELNLSSNQLSTFSMMWFADRTMHNFVNLNLQNNQIQDLPPEAFIKMPALQDLNLEGNKLSQIQDGIFASRTLLDTFLLSNNQLQVINAGILPKLRNVEKLTLVNNKLTCDCNLQSFANWLKMHVEVVESANEIVCAVPRMYKNRRVLQLMSNSQDPFTCVFPQIITRPRYKSLALNSGASQELMCSISNAAVADIVWTLPDATELQVPFQDKTIPTASRQRLYAKASGSLILQNVALSDTGRYTCQTLNSIGTDEIIYDIRVVIPITSPPRRPNLPTTVKPTTKAKPTVKPVTGVPNHVPVQTTSLPRVVTVKVPPVITKAPKTGVLPGGRVTVGPVGGVTAKSGAISNRTTLMTFTLPQTTLPPGLCNPNPCRHGGECQIVLKDSSIESDEDESQESYSSSLPKQGARTYNTPSPDEMYVAQCTCRKKWGGPVCQYKKPEMPTSVKVLESDSNLITLSWNQIGNIHGYRILYSKVGDRTIVKSMPIHPQVSSYTMEQLSTDATYRVCVVAFNLGGESPIGEENCIWAETAAMTSGFSSTFNIQLIAIGCGCLVLLVILVLSLYCYQRLHKKRQDEDFEDNIIVRRPAPRPHSSASEMIRRSMRRPTGSFYSNSEDVMLIDLANHQRQGYMNPFDSNRHSMLLSDLERSSGSLAFAENPRVYPRQNPRNTLKIQEDTPL